MLIRSFGLEHQILVHQSSQFLIFQAYEIEESVLCQRSVRTLEMRQQKQFVHLPEKLDKILDFYNIIRVCTLCMISIILILKAQNNNNIMHYAVPILKFVALLFMPGLQVNEFVKLS